MGDGSSEPSFDIDPEELDSIEEELFNLEDELIEMQGTTVRSLEEESSDSSLENFRRVFAYGQPGENALWRRDLESSTGGSGEQSAVEKKLERLHRELGNYLEVKPGQLLAADLRQQEPEFRRGLYVLSTDGGRRLFAGRPGQVSWVDNTVHVLPVRKISGDLTAQQGDIRYNGSVLVEGDVRDGRFIEATGNIWILGGVGRSTLKSNGDIILKGGLKGHSEHRVETHGNFYAPFVENATVRAGSDVFVEDVILHSDIQARGSVYVLGDEGSIVGGEIHAGDRIFATDLGSRNYPDTHLHLGERQLIREDLEKLRRRRDELKNEKQEMTTQLRTLAEKQRNQGLGPREEERMSDLQFDLNHLREDYQKIEERVEDLQEKLKGSKSPDSELIVRRDLFPRVSIRIGKRRFEAEEKYDHTTLRLVDNEIDFRPYHEPEFELNLRTQIDPEEQDMDEQHEMLSLQELRRHVVYWEEEPLFNREDQLKRYMGLRERQEIVILDVTDDHIEFDEEEEEEEEKPVHVWWGIEVREGENKKAVRRHFDAQKRDSVKVRCETPREGLLKAAEYFDLSPDELAVQIIENGDEGFMGIGKKKYLIRVVKRESIRTEEDQEMERDLMDQIDQEQDVAGFFNIDNSPDGLKLAVYPPEGHGLPVSLDEVREELEEKGFTTEVDWDKVQELVEEQNEQPTVIAPRQRDPEVDGQFEVNVNEQETQATLTVTNSKPSGIDVQKEEVEEYLESEGIEYMQEQVDRVFEEELYGEEVVVAEGEEPEHGEDAELELLVEFHSRSSEDELDAYTTVDHRERGEISSVEKNEVLAEVTPATEGRPGRSVRGERIPPQPGEELDVKAGENTYFTNDGTRITSEREGRVRFEDGEIRVEPVLVVEGDLDYEVGNVDFDGVVVVKGTILDGFRVSAGQRVEAESVGKAHVESGGDVVIDRGVAGKGEGRIEAGGDVFAKFIESAHVRAEGSVVVKQSVLHSTIQADEYVIVEGTRRGDIIGGLTRAGKAVRANRLGSSMSPKTEIEVGISPSLRIHIAELENQIEDQKEQFRQVRKGLQGLKDLASRKGGRENLSEENREKWDQFTTVARSIKHKIEGLKGELRDLRNHIESNEGGAVHVEDEVFSGVNITIQMATMHITEERSHVRYVLENGEVIRMDYIPLDVDLNPPE